MTEGQDFLSRLQKDVESSLLVTEEANQRLRKSGQEALAAIISLVDSGIRIGDSASMILFTLDVQPAQGESFRADTQNAISDTSRPNFIPGAQVYVRYDPNDTSQVVIDRPGPPVSKSRAVTCNSCGAAQIVEEGQLVCIYCRAPLPK